MPLFLDDLQHLNAAHGYCELGMFLDADAELEQIDADVRHLPEVLAFRIDIYRGLKKWELMQAVAKKLARADPANVQWFVSWAYATRRAESIEAARTILTEAFALHSKRAIVAYNIACYECQTGDLHLAKKYLEHAFKCDKNYRLIAL